jgi:uncharacterized protein (DUF2235 family)
LDGKLNEGIRYAYHAVAIDERRWKFPPNLWKEEGIDRDRQTVEQVWFAGVHSDVGGWYHERGLSNIALSWMLRKAVGVGLQVAPGFVEKLEINAFDKQHESWSRWWRLLPYRRRRIPNGAKVHESVKRRMAEKSLPSNKPYRPKMLLRVAKTVKWVGGEEDGGGEAAGTPEESSPERGG